MFRHMDTLVCVRVPSKWGKIFKMFLIILGYYALKLGFILIEFNRAKQLLKSVKISRF